MPYPSQEGERTCWKNRSAAGPPHTPHPHSRNERRELPPQAKQGERRLAAFRRTGRRLAYSYTVLSRSQMGATPLPCRPRSSGRWYTIPPPQWYGLPTPLTPVPAASGALPKNSRQGDGALQAFEAGCGVPVGGLQADYEASARLPKTETSNLLDGHSSWWRLRAECRHFVSENALLEGSGGLE